MHRPLTLALVAALAMSVANGALALPPADTDTALAARLNDFIKTASVVPKAWHAETDPHSLDGICLSNDRGTLIEFLDAAATARNLFRLSLRIKDPDDLKAVDVFFESALGNLQTSTTAIDSMADAEPADCKALPFYTANPTLLQTLGLDALAILGMLSR